VLQRTPPDSRHPPLAGLDFALLQKVRSEITTRENQDSDDEIEEDEEEEEKPEKGKKVDLVKKTAKKEVEEPEEKGVDPVLELQGQCRTAMARNIVRYNRQSFAP
jgi:hypothetical protein